MLRLFYPKTIRTTGDRRSVTIQPAWNTLLIGASTTIAQRRDSKNPGNATTGLCRCEQAGMGGRIYPEYLYGNGFGSQGASPSDGAHRRAGMGTGHRRSECHGR